MTPALRRLTYAATILLAFAARAQPPAPAPVRFDVVTIKPSAPASEDAGMSLRDGTLRVNHLPLKSVITSAYGVREDLISGLPTWADTARFDIVAKVLDPDVAAFNHMSRTERRAIVAALLADRFALKVHTLQKTLPLYELVLAKGGPRFHEHRPATPAGETPSAQGQFKVGNGELTGSDASVFLLLSFLAETLERTVIDRTGLTGRYDYHLTWTPDNATPDNATPANDHAAPSLFTALQEELGLRLNPGKGPVETLVVDHIERPQEN